MSGAQGALLVALLRRAGGPRPADEYRLAAARAERCGHADAWRLADPDGAAWGDAVRQLRATGRLIEDPVGRTWAPGARLDAVVTEGWPDEIAELAAPGGSIAPPAGRRLPRLVAGPYCTCTTPDLSRRGKCKTCGHYKAPGEPT